MSRKTKRIEKKRHRVGFASPSTKARRGLAGVALALSLAACASKPPPPPPTALVPIREACVPVDFPKAPAGYADDNPPKGPDHLVDRFRLGASANAARKARLALVEPIVEACR